MSLILYDTPDSEEAIIWSRSVSPSQWDEARKDLLIRGLKYIANQLKKSHKFK